MAEEISIGEMSHRFRCGALLETARRMVELAATLHNEGRRPESSNEKALAAAAIEYYYVNVPPGEMNDVVREAFYALQTFIENSDPTSAWDKLKLTDYLQ